MKDNRTVARALDMLELFAEKNDTLSLAEITALMKIPKTSAYDILLTLVNRGYLEPTAPDAKSYKLGLQVFQVGYAYLNNIDIYSIAKPLIKDLVKKTNKTVFLGTLKRDSVVYLDKCEPDESFYLRATIGSIEPAYCTGLGKAMLATMSDENLLKTMGEGPYDKRTENTITTFEELKTDMQSIRTRGYSIDNGENENQIFCFAAPIRDHNGNMVAAVSLSSLYMNYTSQQMKELPASVINTALEISRGMGFSGDNLY